MASPGPLRGNIVDGTFRFPGWIEPVDQDVLMEQGVSLSPCHGTIIIDPCCRTSEVNESVIKSRELYQTVDKTGITVDRRPTYPIQVHLGVEGNPWKLEWEVAFTDAKTDGWLLRLDKRFVERICVVADHASSRVAIMQHPLPYLDQLLELPPM